MMKRVVERGKVELEGEVWDEEGVDRDRVIEGGEREKWGVGDNRRK
jgi:hypothetical protein